ncbi:MAG: hypothetical protein A3J74_01885 [Elusimicrobia bacterium RIFCSPHIGHO2_02_FULL_57_9]|nr:MAG: hypothetical protein A3J74_01885 [Elusimicrobia bacterium RIFCSPHIGHO2_02_FULL_57_9]
MVINAVEDTPVSSANSMQRAIEFLDPMGPWVGFKDKDMRFNSAKIRLTDTVEVPGRTGRDIEPMHSSLCVW